MIDKDSTVAVVDLVRYLGLERSAALLERFGADGGRRERAKER